MQIKTVAVFGAGAIGAYFIAGLADQLGENLWVVADGERKARLEKNGLVINGRAYRLNVKTPAEARGVDLLIVPVKYGALRGILDDIALIAGDDTIILSPLNGVDSEQIIAERVGEKNIVLSMMKVAAHRIGNEVKFNPDAALGVVFGEKDGGETPRISALKELFAAGGVHYKHSANIIQDIWFKFALNVSRNIPQAIINCGFGAYTASEHVAYLSAKMRAEVIAVATAQGIDISDNTNPSGVNIPNSPAARFSTLQDLDAKRPTEIDMFSGAVVRMGQRFGIPTPYNDFAYHAVKALEEKNAGKF